MSKDYQQIAQPSDYYEKIIGLKKADAMQASAFFSLPDSCFVKRSVVAAILNISNNTLYLMEKNGGGPNFSKFGGRAVRYAKGDVVKWINEQKS